VILAVEKTREGEWPRFKGISLQGKTVGLVGCGAIGKETARKLAGFDCEILAHDIIEDKIFASKQDVQYVTIEELLPKSDLVSLHLPGIPETKGLVNKDFLSRMKPGSYLVNTARGELIDESALISALRSGHLHGAALDVFQQEPPESDNPLLKMDQVIVTPHMGAHSDSATNAMGWMALGECLAVLQGQNPKYRVV
jgi:D-3-phosphoglycerate dehydrogenase